MSVETLSAESIETCRVACWEGLLAGRWMKVASLETRGTMMAVHRDGEVEEVLNISDSDSPAKVVFRGTQKFRLPASYSLGLEIEARQAGAVKISLAAWDKSELAARHCFETTLVAGRNLVPVFGTSPVPGSQATAVLSFKAEPACEAVLVALRLIAEGVVRPKNERSAKRKPKR
jgi:hypothetical protein